MPSGRRPKPFAPLTDAERAKVEAALPLLEKIAASIHRTLPPQVEFDDLYQWGLFGLAGAVRKYDVARGVKFQTYADPRIRGAIADGIREMDWVPRTERVKQKRQGKQPTQVASLFRKWFETDSGKDFRECDAIEDRNALARTRASEESDLFERVTRGMTRDLRLLVKLLYLDGVTMKEAGRAIGFSESRVSQMHAKALAILKSRVQAGELPCLEPAA